MIYIDLHEEKSLFNLEMPKNALVWKKYTSITSNTNSQNVPVKKKFIRSMP